MRWTACPRGLSYGGPDNPRQKFTGKERDSETGLDYFGARYFSSAQGRFTSPDPTFLNILKVVNPQRWNLYGYGLNNPLKYVDPDGQEAIAIQYPGFEVHSRNSLPGVPLGHGGVVIVAKDGSTHYFEYGRYAGPDGLMRTQPTPPVERDATGDITPESMTNLLKALSQEAGRGGQVDALVIQTTELQDDVMEAYLESRLKQNSDPKRQKYDIGSHNCGTLICDTLHAAQAATVPQKFLVMQSPAAVFRLLWSLYLDSQAVSYDPKTKVTSTITYNLNQ
jgi:RHS repeat-associated protein